MESFAVKPEFIQQVAEPSPLYASTVNINCRKKLDFEDKHHQQHKVKGIRNMPLASNAGVLNHSNYTSPTKKSYNNQSHTPKLPSNTKRNARERKRVRTINDYFNQLQKYLPYTKPQPSGTTPGPKKLSKVETLKAAIEFIEHLQQYAPSKAQLNNTSKLNVSSSPSSVSSTSVQSSPTSASFTSNMSLVEKLKIKCETPTKQQEIKYKATTADFHVTANNSQPTLNNYDTNANNSSYNPSTSSYNAGTVNPVAPIQPNLNYTNESINPSEVYFNNYNTSSYQYHDVTARHQVSPINSYSQYGGHQAVGKVTQPDLTSSPTYSTSSSECYGTYNPNLMAVSEVQSNCPVDFNNNNGVCFNSRFNGQVGFQYQQYNNISNNNAPAVQYC